MKDYTEEIFKEKLRNINFPDYKNFSDTNSAYSDFLDKLTGVINYICSNETI